MIYWWLCLMFLNAIDMVLTRCILHAYPTSVYEANPILGHFSETYGLGGEIAFKTIVSTLPVILIYKFCSATSARTIMMTICSVFAVIMVYMMGLWFFLAF